MRIRSLALVLATAFSSGIIGARATVRAQSAAPLQLLAFTDTSSVRIDLRASGASASAGAPVRAVIVGVGETSPLWSGILGTLAIDSTGSARLEAHIDHLKPRIWSPSSPALYRLTVTVPGRPDSSATIRFGFRSFAVREGRLVLNGRPIFLNGNAINPPGRTIPDSLDDNPRFAADYVAYMKHIHVNMIRLARTSQVWLDVCDSLGMMVYQGLYGTPEGSSKGKPPTKPLADVLTDYHQVLDPLVNHPSVVVYVLSNELSSRDIIQSPPGADSIAAFLSRVHNALWQWDSTRAYIANAGYGYGRSGDICDLHHYWGWYYNTVLSYYTLRDPHTCWRTAREQPITVSENTGSYIGGDGRFNIVSDSKQMSAQLNFTGHAPLGEQAARDGAYEAFAVRNAIEIMRRTRREDPSLAGLMPFTTLFTRWWDIHSFADMTPSPAARQFAISYQPVLLSWEMWTPQLYAGATLRPTAHVVNDDTVGRALHAVSLRWRLLDAKGVARRSGTVAIGDVAYYAAPATRIDIPLSESMPEGSYTLEGRLFSAGRMLSRNSATVFIARRALTQTSTRASMPPARRIALYDPAGHTAAALRALHIAFVGVRSTSELHPATDALVIGAFAWSNALDAAALRAFVQHGGRALVLEQDSSAFDPSWLGARLHLISDTVDAAGDRRPGNPYRNGMAVNPERPDHPLFAGLTRDRLFLWSDPAGWTERSPGLPAVYPVTHGFVLDEPPENLGHVAIIADYGRGLEGVGAAEIFDGDGSVVLTGFDLVAHAGVDPAADRMLANAVRYASSASPHFAHVLVRAPIEWGEYGSESGIAVGIYSGLIENTVPVMPEGLRSRYPVTVDGIGFQFAGERGGWNTKPAIQYVAQGRRPFGPYHFDLFGAAKLPKDRDTLGTGHYWMRVRTGTNTMSTAVENPTDVPLSLELTLNGVAQRDAVPAHSTHRFVTPLHGATDLAVTVHGDRSLVLLETTFQ